METVLTESLEILRPHWVAPLFAPEILPMLAESAKRLVPTATLRAGFECRLARNSVQVDVQQCFMRKSGEHEALAGHLAALLASPEAAHPAWQRIGAFCTEWGSETSPLRTIVELWLEYDLVSGAAGPAAPSVFFGLDQATRPSARSFSTAEAALGLLNGRPLLSEIRRNLHRCFEACGDVAIVSHIGAMLARETDVLRVNIKYLPPEEIPIFLERVGWPGDWSEVSPLLARFCSMVDAITVCLDVGAEISPRIGLECFFQWQPGREVRWRAFLDGVVALGLCTEEKADALMAWPGYTDPSSTPAPWPAALIAQSLLQSPDRFSVLNRELLHIKVTSQPGRSPEAKAYFGFYQSWLLPDTGPKEEIPHAPARPEAQHKAAGEIDTASALEAAAGFLLAARSRTGWWLEYDEFQPGGAGDEWITGYVGAVMATLPDERCQRAALWAWKVLEQRHTSEGWGMNPSIPGDADGTLWGLRLAQEIGASSSERALEARSFLMRHVRPTGGFTTFYEEEFLRFTGHSAIPEPTRHWFDVHTCVTAAAAGLHGMSDHTLPHLRQTQQRDGSWKGYWWADDEYATALASEALAGARKPEDRWTLLSAANWALARIRPEGFVATAAQPDGSAFATALAIRTLAAVEDLDSVRGPQQRAVQWLLDQQQSDGSWTPAATFYANPSEVPPLPVRECRGVFTTATVIAALRAFRG